MQSPDEMARCYVVHDTCYDIFTTMNQLEQPSTYERRRNATESAETNAEAKEKQVEEAEKKLAAKERAEVVGKEVKSTKQQIQHILANMQQVVLAVAAIRKQLQLSDDNVIPSVEQDKKSLDALRKKLDGLMSEMGDLRVALTAEETKAVQEEYPDWNAAAVAAEVEQRVTALYNKLALE